MFSFLYILNITVYIKCLTLLSDEQLSSLRFGYISFSGEYTINYAMHFIVLFLLGYVCISLYSVI